MQLRSYYTIMSVTSSAISILSESLLLYFVHIEQNTNNRILNGTICYSNSSNSNDMQYNVVTATTIITFEKRLDKHWKNHEYDHTTCIVTTQPDLIQTHNHKYIMMLT